jgi:hypothetical protein
LDRLFDRARAASPLVKPIFPPEMGFYSKEIDYDGIKIKSADVVADGALFEAKRRLDMMLKYMPQVKQNLHNQRAELHIIGKNQLTSDLPENRHFKGNKNFDAKRQLDIDERARGTGGLFASVGEENLLFLENDRFYGRDICVHEFAHTIMICGLDDRIKSKIDEQYKRSKKRGLWKGTYADTNEDEFFAELSMWFFGTRGDYGSLSPSPEAGPQWLKSYDPDAFSLLDHIYSGRLKSKQVRVRTLTALSANLESSMKSLRSDYKTTLKMTNLTDESVKLFWLDYSGVRQPYGEIEPGASFSQQTYVTHPFLLADKHGKGLAIFVAVHEAGSGVLR